MLDCCGCDIPEHIIDFIDLERYGKYCGEETLSEYSSGLIEFIKHKRSYYYEYHY